MMIMVDKINEILEKKVRPALLLHSGDVELLSYEDGVVRVRLLGACAGCPSATLTNEEVISAELKAAIPEIKEVVLVQQTSEELLDFARKILRHEKF